MNINQKINLKVLNFGLVNGEYFTIMAILFTIITISYSSDAYALNTDSTIQFPTSNNFFTNLNYLDSALRLSPLNDSEIGNAYAMWLVLER